MMFDDDFGPVHISNSNNGFSRRAIPWLKLFPHTGLPFRPSSPGSPLTPSTACIPSYFSLSPSPCLFIRVLYGVGFKLRFPLFSLRNTCSCMCLSGRLRISQKECKRSSVDDPWSAQRTGRYRCWFMRKALVALYWIWKICVAFFWLRSGTAICLQIWGGQIWNGLLETCGALWCKVVTWIWSSANRPASSLLSLLFCGESQLMGLWLRGRALCTSTCQGILQGDISLSYLLLHRCSAQVIMSRSADWWLGL